MFGQFTGCQQDLLRFVIKSKYGQNRLLASDNLQQFSPYSSVSLSYLVCNCYQKQIMRCAKIFYVSEICLIKQPGVSPALNYYYEVLELNDGRKETLRVEIGNKSRRGF